MNLFGKKKKAPPKLNESIQMLRESINMLDKREKHLDKQIQQALEEAKAKAKAKDKRGENTKISLREAKGRRGREEEV